jgi:vacuolar-type H+-ATPase subunit H
MSAPIADGVMAATYKLVQQAMSGQWQEVPKTIQERRDLLDKISSSARPQDQEWLSALRQAMNESDAAVAGMAKAAGSTVGSASAEKSDATPDAVSTVMDMLGKGG